MRQIFILLLTVTVASMTYGQQGKKTTKEKSSLKEQLVGTWTLVSIDNISADSTRVHPYGENPQGLLMFDTKGNYAIQILKTERPKVASGDKNKCAPEEYAALVQGSNSHFGKYTVDET